MPGFELIGKEEKNNLLKIFSESNGVLFAHGFDGLRNGKFKVREFEKEFSKKLGCKLLNPSLDILNVSFLIVLGSKELYLFKSKFDSYK